MTGAARPSGWYAMSPTRNRSGLLWDRAVAEFQGVDILVNGLVLFNRKGVLGMPMNEWRSQLDVILTGAFLFTKHVAQQMIGQAGRAA